VSFIRAMAAHLREHHARDAEPLSDAELLEFVREATTCARGFGITAAGDVAELLPFLLRHGLGLEGERLHWAVEILSDTHLSPVAKLDRLDHYEIFEIE